ncbi:MAG: MmgE/PrpD family protein [Gammaproteobacteria bacterium]|uniref:MmgE/PrpD family protein n=1 Tax=Marinomonas sp. BSi20584 TaxID=1594462 RepID=UPI000C1EAE72|nr:MmgE/PrpD family protein [Marinomonas sp. BSi20584]MBU1293480.1 MmgE/PrpD family protein [Gammaproteobacteria bacterium]MBU1466528.1 MmgE/PrpD family protein [Gammaproteobacteria bacterium]MBU2021300.1 MmgE/PrpD family protein [Gammaproteobacteria bacterium]MBU2239317.1 MmgE/PrpD family protein [Gammaproteobacteria bacterium]MBU2317984.1 MmgE/PrpD family protein [Gammaproteobacteria bacterium]
MENPIIQLSNLAVHWLTCPLSKDVSWATRRAILDWYATTLPGTVCSPSTELKHFIESASGNAFSYVDGEPRSISYSAFMNGVASHTVEFDDIFKDGGYHPGSPTISAALAIAQNNNVSLDVLHRAIIGAYEVGCRLSLAIQPAHYKYWHTTSTVGTIGAAVACVLLAKGTQEQVMHAIGIASSFAGGHQANLQGEGGAKALHAGHAAQAGILAGNSALAGVKASIDSLSGPFGWANATTDATVNWGKAFAGSYEWTPITRMTIKNHGCCGHIFPAIDGVGNLLTTHNIGYQDIESIDVYGYDATKKMCDRTNPQDAQQARFSLQYCIAAHCLTGKVRLEAFNDETLARQDIRNFAKRVSVYRDEELSKLYPGVRSARVIIKLTNGEELSYHQKTRKGDPEDPLTDDELVQKFNELTMGILGNTEKSRLEYLILQGHEIPNIVTRLED